MTAPSNAKTGRPNPGDTPSDTAAPAVARGRARFDMSQPDDMAGANAVTFASPFGQGQSEAEEQLYAYLNRVKEPRKSGFAPFDALSARLGEFGPLPEHRDAPESEAPEPSSAPQNYRNSLQDESGDAQLAWFDKKFGELKRLISHSDSNKREFLAINGRLAEIVGRLDRLSQTVEGQNAIASVESQLSDLARSFAAMREQGRADAQKISRAAEKMQSVAGNVERAREKFEETAAATLKDANNTIHKTVTITAEQIAFALAKVSPQHGLKRVESELKNLNSQTRESSERAAAALEKVHGTLREFLENDRGRKAEPAHRPRPQMHVPITPRQTSFSGMEDRAGGAPIDKPSIESLMSRATGGDGEERPDFSFEPNVQSNRTKPRAAEGTREKRAHGSPAFVRGNPASFNKAGMFREDERAFPLLGIGAVALALLLASAALYVLHVRTELKHSSVSPSAPEIRMESPNKPSAPSKQGELRPAVPANKTASSRNGLELPALFTAADPNLAPFPKPAESMDDMRKLTDAASRGDPDAQYKVGARFLNDPVMPSNASAAARWLTRSAEQGHREAQFLLGSLFETGAGVLKDEAQALFWYRKAAESGHGRAMHNLAVLLVSNDASEDYREAAKWFGRAADQGLADSQFNLAMLYERGLGMHEDEGKAYFWYSVAARNGDKDAVIEANRLRRRLPAADAGKLENQALAWKARAPIQTGDGSRQNSQS